MACKNCSNSKPCGCAETALTIPEYADNVINTDVCSEVFYDKCIIHGQVDMSMAIGSNTLTIKRGDNIANILQKIMVCLGNTISQETAAVGFRVDSYTENSISLEWNNDDKRTYNLIVKIDDTEETISVGTASNYTLINLISASYEFTLINATTNAKSVTLKMEL